MLARRLKHPRTKGIIVRRVYKDLKENHIDMYWMDFPELRGMFTEKDGIRLPNGSVIGFNYAENAMDVERQFSGPEFGDIFVDQAEQFAERELWQIKSRARWPGMPDGWAKTGLFFNPGGPGTEFLRRIFWLKQYKGTERPEDYKFIQAYGWDNYQWIRGTGLIDEKAYYRLTNDERFELFINHTQYGRTLNAYPPSLRAGLLLGSFESFEGQYFSGVWDESKVLISPIMAERLIQPWWPRWIGMDWGFGHHSAAIWMTTGKVSPSQFWEAFHVQVQYPVDIVIAYREHVVSNMPEEELAQQIADLTRPDERKMLQNIFISPDAIVKKSAHTIAERMSGVWRDNGLPAAQAADDNRVDGWRMLYSGLKHTCSLLSPEPAQERDVPMLLVSSECPQIIQGMPLLIRDTKNAGKMEDVLKTSTIADDVADGLRYAYKSFMSPARVPRAVQAAEVYNSYQDMTARAMALRKFEAKRLEHSRIGKARAR